MDGYLDIGMNDTMKDLIVNLFGSIIGCVYFSLIYNKIEFNSLKF